MKNKNFRAVLLAAMIAAGTIFSSAGSALSIPAAVVEAAEDKEYAPIEDNFEGTTHVGTNRGDCKVEITDEEAHSGTHCLKTSGRKANWHGVIFDISSFAGAKIKISCYVKSSAENVKLTADEGDKWPGITTVSSSMDEWTLVEGEYNVSSSLNNPGVYLEAPDSTDDIYVDDISITVKEALKEPPKVGNEIIKNGSFEEEKLVWTAAGAASVAVDTTASAGSKSLKVTNRAAATDGAAQDLTGYLKAGSTYSVSAKVKQGTADAEYGIYLTCGSNKAEIGKAKLSKDNWSVVSGTYQIPADADMTSAVLSIESLSDKGDFNLDEVTMIEQVALQKDAVAKKIGMSNPLSDLWYGADPYAISYNGRVYIYMTNDSQQYDAEEKNENGFPKKSNGYGAIATLRVISSADMVNWTDHGVIPVAGKNSVDNPLAPAKWANNSWAPAVAYKQIDGKDKFFLYFADNGGGIGVLEADSPVGPFVEPATGSKLITRTDKNAAASEGVVWLFDPAVLVDDDGSAYLYYGGGVDGVDANMPKTSRVVKLSDNMVDIEGEAKVIEAPGIFEDSGIHKYNNKYYYTYCSNFTNTDSRTGNGNICAMVSDSPMGPFVFDNEFFKNPATFFGPGGNNHHCVFSHNGKMYLTYHAQTLGKAVDYINGYRSTHIDELTYGEDGKIKAVTGTYEGVAQLENFNPYQKIEAETFAWQSGINVADMSKDGVINTKLTDVRNNSWVALGSVAFGDKGAKSLTANIATKTGGKLEIYLDNLEGEPVDSLTIESTGSEDTFKDMTWDVTGLTGTHHVFLVFKSLNLGDKMEMDYYSFAENTSGETPDPTPNPTPDPTPDPTPNPTPNPVKKPTVKLNYRSLDLQVKKSTGAVVLKSSTAKGDKIKSAVSSNKKIATVTVKSGKLTIKGVKAGKAVITVTTVKGGTVKVTMNVKKKVSTKKLTVSPKKLSLKKGKKATIKATVAPVTSTDKVTFKANKKIVKVSSKGVVTALKKGSTTVKVKSGKKTVNVKVTVK